MSVIHFPPASPTAAIVDQIGLLKAQLAPQLEQLKKLETQLKANGPGTYVGTHFDATISVSERESLDMEAVRAKLSPQFIRAHTKTTVVKTLRVVARVLNRQPTDQVG